MEVGMIMMERYDGTLMVLYRGTVLAQCLVSWLLGMVSCAVVLKFLVKAFWDLFQCFTRQKKVSNKTHFWISNSIVGFFQIQIVNRELQTDTLEYFIRFCSEKVSTNHKPFSNFIDGEPGTVTKPYQYRTKRLNPRLALFDEYCISSNRRNGGSKWPT